MIKNKDIIHRIEKINGVKLLPYEIKFLDKLIEAKKQDKRLIIRLGRQSSRTYDRAVLMYSVYPKPLFPKKVKYKPSKNKRVNNYLKKDFIFDELNEEV